MGCFLTATLADLNQMRDVRQQSPTQGTIPMSRDQFLDKVKQDVCDIADMSLDVDLRKLEEASAAASFDTINDVLTQLDESAEAGGMSKQEAIRESEAILSEIAEAGAIKGLAGTTTAPVDLLGQYAVGTSEWRGARFELRFAAVKAADIAEVDCSNYVDVQMKDGSYRELKSFTTYGTSQRQDVLDQLAKDIDPHSRGITDVKVVFDGSYATPSSSFIERLHSDIEHLKSELNTGASVGCQVLTADGTLVTVF